MSPQSLDAVSESEPITPRSLLPDAVMWHSELTADGLLRVRIDRQDKSVNALSKSMLDELDRLLTEVRRTPAVRGVMFISGKSGNFIVGADVTEMKEIAGGPVATDLSQFGQRVFQSLESLPVPTVALISGSCLGGGLEFAMSCRYRIADDHAKTLLGLPEVKLGLIPGWGGTVVFTRFWTTATLLAHCRGAVRRIRSSSSFEIDLCSVKRHASCHHRRRLPLYAAEFRLRGVTPHDCVESGFCSGEYSTQRLGADSGCLARFPLPHSS